jgi:hypothetical protein
MSTIVSAFISNINSNKRIETYYSLAKLLLSSTTPKIIFLDDEMYNKINNDDYDIENTLLIKFNKTDNYLYSYKNKLSKFSLNTDNKLKDTLEYVFTMCYKTEWVRKAIENDKFNSTNFIWLDIGIKHIYKSSDVEFVEKINSLQYKKYDKIRIGHIWDLNGNFNIDLYSQISWYFAGGVFGGNKEYLLKFANLMKTKCIQIIKERNTIMWEVNIWRIIYLEEESLFNSYSCDHNNSLIDNY